MAESLFLPLVVHALKTHVEKEEIDLNAFEKLLQEIGV